jgi:ribosomal protein S18 acetylase RimI-like enzyme
VKGVYVTGSTWLSANVATRVYDPATDELWAEALLATMLGGRWQARRGEVVDALGGPGLVAAHQSERVGLLTYRFDRSDCEVVALAAARRHAGVGTLLLDALRAHLAGQQRRIWLVTTNDNVDALRFYQRRGFRLSALRSGAVDQARLTLKPGISAVGAYGIPLRDELELELFLD